MRIRRVIKLLSSLKLAVIVILSIAGLTAWGTFVEAEYDAEAAAKIVYHSVWMYLVLGLLAVNLLAVMADRWPWKKQHTGFVIAHIGILTLLSGALVTKIYGVDGSISLAPGEKGSLISVGNVDLAVYATFDGSKYAKIFAREVDFFRSPPSVAKPLEIPLSSEKIAIRSYLPYAFREEKIVVSEQATAGAGLRFQLQNDKVNVTEWLLQPASDREVEKNLGPARVVVNSKIDFERWRGQNVIAVQPMGEESVKYAVFSAKSPRENSNSRRGKLTKLENANVKQGVLKPGETLETGWMGLKFRVLKYLPRAMQFISFKAVERPSPLTTSAIEIEFHGKSYWMSINSLLKLFTDREMYVVSYGNRRIDTGIPLKLNEFKVGRYQGTMRAASYESVVELPDGKTRTISMNEPLKLGGFTFYQASFQEDERGKPVSSVFSVNRDPGRWVKYLGALLIVFGSTHLFYFRRRAVRGQKAER